MELSYDFKIDDLIASVRDQSKVISRPHQPGVLPWAMGGLMGALLVMAFVKINAILAFVSKRCQPK